MIRSTSSQPRRAPPPLDAAALERLALRYVERFATTRRKLADYLCRKLAERGWAGDGAPPVEALVERMAELRYVDDQAFALARGASLSRRGYGDRRVGEALRAAGVDEVDGAPAREAAREGALAAALALARRKRIGPYAAAPMERDGRERAVAALVRAGHSPALARRIAATPPGETVEE